MNLFTQPLSTLTNLFNPTQVQEQSTLISKEQFIKFRDAFRVLANDKKIKAEDILLYNVVRGLPITRGFTPVTNPIKLINGQSLNHTICNTLGCLKFHIRQTPADLLANFDNFIDIDDIKIIMDVLVKESTPYN